MRRLLIGVLVIALSLALGGCSSAGEEIAGGEVEVDEDRVTVETDEGVATIAGGEGVLVDEFPDDYPLYDNAAVVTSTVFGSPDGRQQIYVLLSSDDSVSDVYDWYKAKLTAGGWTLKDDVKMTTADGEMMQLVAESGTREAALMINTGADGTELILNIYVDE